MKWKLWMSVLLKMVEAEEYQYIEKSLAQKNSYLLPEKKNYFHERVTTSTCVQQHPICIFGASGLKRLSPCRKGPI